MQPENNDKPRLNPTRPDLNLQKMRSLRSQQEPYILRIQSKRAARRKLILQVAQYFIMLTVDGQKDNYGSAKVIVETAQLVYPWITQHQVYANMRLLKHPWPVVIDNTVDLRGGRPKGNTAADTRLLN